VNGLELRVPADPGHERFGGMELRERAIDSGLARVEGERLVEQREGALALAATVFEHAILDHQPHPGRAHRQGIAVGASRSVESLPLIGFVRGEVRLDRGQARKVGEMVGMKRREPIRVLERDARLL
jgi:hypothetical protein